MVYPRCHVEAIAHERGLLDLTCCLLSMSGQQTRDLAAFAQSPWLARPSGDLQAMPLMPWAKMTNKVWPATSFQTQ